MIPTNGELLFLDRTGFDESSFTYKIDGNRINGTIDGVEAVKQAVELILRTERFAHSIYSWDYGAEIMELYNLTPELTRVRLKTRIEEALLVDKRIKSLQDFVIDNEKGKFFVSFTINSVFGQTEYKGEF